MQKHTFGLPIKTEQLNMCNTATVSDKQLFNQNNTLAAYFSISISKISSYICWSSNRIPNQKTNILIYYVVFFKTRNKIIEPQKS
jgi:hypothetical protein